MDHPPPPAPLPFSRCFLSLLLSMQLPLQIPLPVLCFILDVFILDDLFFDFIPERQLCGKFYIFCANAFCTLQNSTSTSTNILLIFKMSKLLINLFLGRTVWSCRCPHLTKIAYLRTKMTCYIVEFDSNSFQYLIYVRF